MTSWRVMRGVYVREMSDGMGCLTRSSLVIMRC